MKLKSEEEDKVLNDDNDNRIAVDCKYDNVFAGGHSKKKDKEDDDVDDIYIMMKCVSVCNEK